MLHICQIWRRIHALERKISLEKRRKGDIAQIYADNKLAKEKLNWEAKESLEKSMRSAWKWENRKLND